MYKVIRAFKDSADGNRLYGMGDVYPAEGAKVSKARINDLLTGANRHGKTYLEEVPDSEPVEV